MTPAEKEALREAVTAALRPVRDPEMRIGIVDLGLIYDIDINDNAEIRIKMTLTTPACPYGEMMIDLARRAAEQVENVTSVEIVMVWDPPWDPQERCSDLAKDQLGIW